MKQVNYTLQDVQNKLGVKIANLEIQLANEQSAKEAIIEYAKELEKKVAELEEKVDKKKKKGE